MYCEPSETGDKKWTSFISSPLSELLARNSGSMSAQLAPSLLEHIIRIAKWPIEHALAISEATSLDQLMVNCAYQRQ